MFKAKPNIIGFLLGVGITLLMVFAFLKFQNMSSNHHPIATKKLETDIDYSGIQIDSIKEKIISKGQGPEISPKKSFSAHLNVWIYDPKAVHNQGPLLFSVENRTFDGTMFPPGAFRSQMIKEYLIPPNETFFGKGSLYPVPGRAILLVRLEVEK